jgi:hypothetical protein
LTNINTGAAGTSNVADSEKPHRLTIFTFFWACQAAVHMEFFHDRQWLTDDNPMGWILAGLIVLTMMFPASIALFSLMIFSSVVFNIGLWPYVVNHIVLESIINMTMLIVIAYTLYLARTRSMSGSEIRDEIFDKLAPVLFLFVITMYWFIVLSKTNWDFFNYQLSCISDFYIDVTDRMGFLGLPELDVSVSVLPAAISLWVFMVVEVAIPLLLMFRKTRYLALIIGIPFHLLLAIVGHRTFSGFILALYVLITADSVAVLFADIRDRLGNQRIKMLARAGRISLVVMALVMTVLYFSGSAIPAFFFKYRYWYFLMFFGPVGLLILYAIVRQYTRGDSKPTEVWTMTPQWVWLMAIPVFLNGLSPYAGFKTETSFAMYSNLHTEGEYNNHLFMPRWNVVKYQEDLVDILETDHPKLQKWIEVVPLKDREKILRKLNVVHFEINRVVAETMGKTPEMEFFVRYTRNNGAVQTFRSTDPDARYHELAQLEPLWKRKLMFYRPVFAGELSYCQH